MNVGSTALQHSRLTIAGLVVEQPRSAPVAGKSLETLRSERASQTCGGTAGLATHIEVGERGAFPSRLQLKHRVGAVATCASPVHPPYPWKIRDMAPVTGHHETDGI